MRTVYVDKKCHLENPLSGLNRFIIGVLVGRSVWPLFYYLIWAFQRGFASSRFSFYQTGIIKKCRLDAFVIGDGCLPFTPTNGLKATLARRSMKDEIVANARLSNVQTLAEIKTNIQSEPDKVKV